MWPKKIKALGATRPQIPRNLSSWCHPTPNPKGDKT